MLSKERISSLEREMTLSSSALQNLKDELSVKSEDYDVSLYVGLLYAWCVLDFKCNLSHLTAIYAYFMLTFLQSGDEEEAI